MCERGGGFGVRITAGSGRWSIGSFDRQGYPLPEESPVPDKYASALCFDEISSVRADVCDDSIDVPQLGSGVLHCNVVANLEVRQVMCMLVVPRLCFLLSLCCCRFSFFDGLLPLRCE